MGANWYLLLKILCAGGICDPGPSLKNDVALYAKTEGRKEHITLDTLSIPHTNYCQSVCQMAPPQFQVKTVKTLLNAKDKSLFL